MTCPSGKINRSLKRDHGLIISSSSGLTLIETIVALGVFIIFFAAVAQIFQLVLANIAQSRIRTTALSIAQEKFEIINNLPYSQVGTMGGIPAGPIVASETQNINGLDFQIQTSVVYVDDPFDYLSPQDIINTDYKRIRIQVTWGGLYPSRTPITIISNIAPKGEEAQVNGGTLYLQVFNSQGNPVDGATVNIDNTQIVPAIHTQTYTDENGLVILPGSPVCVTCYRIAVTKNNYSSDKTYTTSEVTNPLQPYATVIEGEVTQLSFKIDQVSSVTISSFGSREAGYPPIAGVPFVLRGAKIIGYDAYDDPVYKYKFVTSTGGGTVNISGLEWDMYTLDLSLSTYNLAGSNSVSPFVLNPNSHVDVDMVAVPKTSASLLLVVRNSSQNLIASASAQLTHEILGYDTTIYTGATNSADFGQAYFGSLTPETYNLRVNFSAYQEATSSLLITSNKQELILLNPIE